MGRDTLEARIETALEMREHGRTWDEVGNAIGKSADSARKMVRRHVIKQPLEKQVEIETQHRVIEGDIENPRIAALLAQAEVNLDIWEPVRSVVNHWAGKFQAKVWLKYKPGVEAMIQFKEDILADLEAIKLPTLGTPLLPGEDPTADPVMVEISLFDIHVGKLAYGEETGENYDSSIAVQRFHAAGVDLAERSVREYQNIAQWVYPVGNDLLHTDGVRPSTTAGTPMDTDQRFYQMFRTAVRINAEMIRYLSTIAPVHVPIIPGNHDHVMTFCVGEVLAAMFAGDDRVTIDEGTRLRKYYRWGICLLGYTHGNDEKHNELPQIMADERRQDWADTYCNEWHLGHRHNKKQMHFTSADQYRTVGVRILPSLTGQDAWHHKKGYRHLPQAEAHVYSKKHGYMGMKNHWSPIERSEFDGDR